jgi:hypothetical protein
VAYSVLHVGSVAEQAIVTRFMCMLKVKDVYVSSLYSQLLG